MTKIISSLFIIFFNINVYAQINTSYQAYNRNNGKVTLLISFDQEHTNENIVHIIKESTHQFFSYSITKRKKNIFFLTPLINIQDGFSTNLNLASSLILKRKKNIIFIETQSREKSFGLNFSMRLKKTKRVELLNDIPTGFFSNSQNNSFDLNYAEGNYFFSHSQYGQFKLNPFTSHYYLAFNEQFLENSSLIDKDSYYSLVFYKKRKETIALIIDQYGNYARYELKR